MIDCIETNRFVLGVCGRSGTRSIVNYLTRYYFDYQWENMRQLHQGWAPRPENMPMPTHHPYTATTVEQFNKVNRTNKFMVVRNPIDRANSGIRVGYTPDFHGAPVLQDIDWKQVNYIIDFHDLEQYLGNTDVYKGVDSKTERLVAQRVSSIGPSHYRDMEKEWSLDDYDYTNEIEVYENVMDTKERLPIDLWIHHVLNIKEINIPSKII